MKKLFLVLAFGFISLSAKAQNTYFHDVAMQSITQTTAIGNLTYLAPIPGATITVCSSTGIGTPCAPILSGLCASATDTVCNQANPTTADNYGNYGFWVPSSGLNYNVSITGTGVTGKLLGYSVGGLTPGKACTNGELALSAGWGSTATVTAAAGSGQTCEWTLTSNGSDLAASPTIVDTLTNPLPSANFVCDMRMVGGSGTNTLINQTVLSATVPSFTFGGTPAGSSATYIVVRRCGP